MLPNTSQLAALSRIFSSSVFRQISKHGQSALFTRLLIQAGVAQIPGQTVGDAFDAAFTVLRRSGLRDEYVYRAALTKNILLGMHSLNTACMLTEFRVGSCKADLAILNGTSTVYEIKSERDSLVRLSNQIENYRKVFAKIYVIASDGHIQEIVENTPAAVGVMCLNQRNQITKIREAADNSDKVCSTSIFESLRSTEALEILNDFGVSVPDVPNTILHSTMREKFSRLPPKDVHSAMVKTLKRTRSLASLSDFVERMPFSLRTAALSIQIHGKDRDRLVKALGTPLVTAMDWV